MTVIARVVTKRDDARLAMLLTGIAALGLVLVLADERWHLQWLPGPGDVGYALVAALIALGGVGPWMAWARRHGRAVALRCEARALRIGRQTLAAEEVEALSVVRARRGYAVAITRRRDVTFLELERSEDAARVAASLGGAVPTRGSADLRSPSRVLALPQAVLSLVAVVFAATYLVFTARDLAWSVADPRAVFGLGGVVAAELSMLLLLVRRLRPGHALSMSRRTAWDAHVALHTSAEQAALEGAEGPEVVPARVPSLSRAGEPVRAWLARIDALPTEQHAYRGDAVAKDVLWETLGDDGAPIDARMGAARVLRRHHGEPEEAVVRAVEDPDVRVRVEAAMDDDQEDAERHLEALGPLFRAR